MEERTEIAAGPDGGGGTDADGHDGGSGTPAEAGGTGNPETDAAPGGPEGPEGTEAPEGTCPPDGREPLGGDGGGSGRAAGRIKIAALAAAAVLIVFLAAVPTALLRTALNRDFEPGSGWGRMSASKARVSLFLTGFRVEGLSLWEEGADAPALTVESVSGSGLRPLSVLAAVLGRGDPSAIVSGRGQLTARGAVFDGEASGGYFTSAKLDTLALSGLDWDAGGGGQAENVRLRSLRIGGLEATNAFGETARLDSFSLAGLADGVAGRITAGGLFYGGGEGGALSVEGFSAGGLDLKIASAPRGNAAGFALSLFEALDSLDLDHFSWQTEGTEKAYLRSARLDVRADGEGRPLKTLELDGVKLSLNRFLAPGEDDFAAFAAAFGETPEAKLVFSAAGAPGGGPRKYDLGISVADSMDLGFTQNVNRLQSPVAALADFPEGALALLGSQLGEGGIWFADRGAMARLYPVLSERQLDGGDTAGALKEQVLPVIRGLDPEKILNLVPLEGEAALFLDDPRSLGISWRPTPGFPGSAAARAGLLGGPKTGRPEAPEYAVLQEMNVTLSVNGRAPMGVVTAE
ncbi:MAG: hypothetical protein LBQ79_00370 [Deltaproteobacteria bacterium]|nr:hypothetical protein [Deltaproteobacteria bacterium]